MTDDRSLPYRCMISNEDNHAVLKFGLRSVACEVLDLSREDFSVRLAANRKTKDLQRARRLELHYQGERWLVEVKGNHHPLSDIVILTRLQELTPVKMPSAWSSLNGIRLSQQTDPRFILTLMVAFIFSCIALPGLGDQIGTAPKVKKGIHSVLDAFKGANKR